MPVGNADPSWNLVLSIFGLAYAPIGETSLPELAVSFARIFASDIHRYFLDFAYPFRERPFDSEGGGGLALLVGTDYLFFFTGSAVKFISG